MNALRVHGGNKVKAKYNHRLVEENICKAYHRHGRESSGGEENHLIGRRRYGGDHVREKNRTYETIPLTNVQQKTGMVTDVGTDTRSRERPTQNTTTATLPRTEKITDLTQSPEGNQRIDQTDDGQLDVLHHKHRDKETGETVVEQNDQQTGVTSCGRTEVLEMLPNVLYNSDEVVYVGKFWEKKQQQKDIFDFKKSLKQPQSLKDVPMYRL